MCSYIVFRCLVCTCSKGEFKKYNERKWKSEKSAKKIEINIAKGAAIKKSTWKRLVKDKMKNKIEEGWKREMEGKTKSRKIKGQVEN